MALNFEITHFSRVPNLSILELILNQTPQWSVELELAILQTEGPPSGGPVGLSKTLYATN